MGKLSPQERNRRIGEGVRLAWKRRKELATLETQAREAELIDLVLRLAERIFLAHEILARLAERRTG